MTKTLQDKSAVDQRIDGYAPIGSYAAIGDGRAVALVAEDGAIDWLCLPVIDSPPFFGALVDARTGGRWQLRPSAPFEVTRRYIPRTNVLETTFTTSTGCVRVTDALTVDLAAEATWRELVRRVDCIAGEVELESRIEPAPRFGRDDFELTRREKSWLLRSGELQVGLQFWGATDEAFDGAALTSWYSLRDGDSALIALLASENAPLPVPSRHDLERRLDTTITAWRQWLDRHIYDGAWRDSVERSLLVLKLLSDSSNAGMAAAATTSLPEAIGGQRNYDYRFGWVRDTTFALDAFLRLGYTESAHTTFTWLLDATSHTHPRINPVYGLDGTPITQQQSVPVDGYRGSQPVRAGNAAGKQLQLDGFGDFVETTFLYTRAGHILDPETSERLADLADVVERIWTEPDAGIWELGDHAHYTASKVSCWQLLDRVIQMVNEGQVPDRHSTRWLRARERIREHVEREHWSERRQSYVQKAGSDDLDAATLLLARRRFGDPAGERMTKTIAAVRSELGAGGPLLYRYTGMREQENAFLACSFWLVQALALAGSRDEAAGMMDELTALASGVGLFSEEMEPAGKQMRGNFPQALTHLSLLTAAAFLNDAQS